MAKRTSAPKAVNMMDDPDLDVATSAYAEEIEGMSEHEVAKYTAALAEAGWSHPAKREDALDMAKGLGQGYNTDNPFNVAELAAAWSSGRKEAEQATVADRPRPDAAEKTNGQPSPAKETATGDGSRSKQLGAYLVPHESIPSEIKAFVASKLGHDTPTVPARQDGSYKGRVILNSDAYMVQAVGKDQSTAVMHRKEDLELVGGNLKWRDANKRLGSFDVQVHYKGDKGKVYTWDREREQQDKVMGKAEAYAKSIADPAERESFLKNVKAMTGKSAEDAASDRGAQGRAPAIEPGQERAAGRSRTSTDRTQTEKQLER